MDPLWLKIILIIVMVLLTVAFGLMPVKILKVLRKRAHSSGRDHVEIEQRKWPSLILCLLTCFTGGVFLATCFLHLLPEVREHMEGIKDSFHMDTHYPWAELISVAGFFLVFFVEELVLLLLKCRGYDASHNHGMPPTLMDAEKSSGTVEYTGELDHRNCSPNSHHCAPKLTDKHLLYAEDDFHQNGAHASPPSVAIAKPGSEASAKRWTPASGQPLLTSSGTMAENESHAIMTGNGVHLETSADVLLADRERPESVEFSDCLEDHVLNPNLALPEIQDLRKRQGSQEYVNGEAGAPEPCFRPHICGEPCASAREVVLSSTARTTAEPECCESGPCGEAGGPCEDPPIKINFKPHAHHHGVRSVTLLIALSFHSVIEGIAFGVQGTTESVTALFLSLIFHKVIVAFGVGLQLARTHAHSLRMVVLSILVLALMSPLGCIFGIAVDQIKSDTKEILVMIFEGLSVGTFLYVTFFEVFIHERDNEHPNMPKMVVSLIGFAVIAAIRSMEHGHDEMGAEGDNH